MDSPALSSLKSLGRAMDVSGRNASQRTNHRTAHAGGDFAYRFEFAFARNRKTGLDDVDVEAGELLGNLNFFRSRQGNARRLFRLRSR